MLSAKFIDSVQPALRGRVRKGIGGMAMWKADHAAGLGGTAHGIRRHAELGCFFGIAPRNGPRALQARKMEVPEDVTLRF